MDIIKAIKSVKSEGDIILRAKVFENGFAVLKRVQSGTVVCCWEIDDEYNEECHENPIKIYNLI